MCDDDPITWIERHFFIPETNRAIILEEYQKAVIREALSKDADGLFKYSTILYSDLKKSAKSTIAGAVALYLAWQTPWDSVRIVANDLKQADSRTFRYIERAILLNEQLKALCDVKRYHITLPNHTTIEAIPVDPKGEAGGGDLMICFTELWAAKTEAAKTLWTETTLSPLKFGKSLRWAESYAGHIGSSPILERLYKEGVERGVPVDVGIDGLELFANENRMLTLWNTQSRCKWQTEAYYSQERSVLDDLEFQRVHQNTWVAPSERIYANFTNAVGGNVSEDADYNPDLPVTWGVDDGYAYGKGPGSESYHPRVVLIGQVTPEGGLNIFYEYYRTGVSAYETTLEEVYKQPYRVPDNVYIDSAAAMFKGAIQNYGPCPQTVSSTHPVVEGIKNVRRLICDANGKRLLKIHPRCKELIREMLTYRASDSGAAKVGEATPLKLDDHGPDTLRYQAWHLRHEQ